MFGLAKRERRLYEERIAAQQEEITWLRGWLRPVPLPVADTATAPDVVYQGNLATFPAMTEEEEDVQHMLEAGEIDKQEAEAILATLGFENTEVEMSP